MDGKRRLSPPPPSRDNKMPRHSQEHYEGVQADDVKIIYSEKNRSNNRASSSRQSVDDDSGFGDNSRHRSPMIERERGTGSGDRDRHRRQRSTASRHDAYRSYAGGSRTGTERSDFRDVKAAPSAGPKPGQSPRERRPFVPPPPTSAPVQRRTLLPLPPPSEKLISSGIADSSQPSVTKGPETVQDSVANLR
jgi:hypothetical protein